MAGGGFGALLVAGGFVGIRGDIANVNVALALVLVVLAAAAGGGRRAGAVSGLVAATAFDFFETRPYGSLKIARVGDLVTTLLLLAVGLVMGEVAERAIRFKARMRDDQRHLRRLHRVSSLAISDDEDESDLVMAVTAELVDALDLEDCSFELPPFARELPHLEPQGTISGSTRRSPRGDYDLPGDGLDLRVVGRSGTIGRFVLIPNVDARVSPERLIVAVSLAQALGLALAGTT